MASRNEKERPHGIRGWVVLWILSGLLIVVVVLLVAAGTAWSTSTSTSASTPAGSLPQGLNQETADLLGVVPVPGDSVPAPHYRLTDQNGRAFDERDLRGRAVVLTFNDDKCADQCAMLAADIVAADRDLPAAERSQVAFVSINANPYYPNASDVKAWSDQHGLGHLPNWYFLTGTPTQLASTAKAYDVPIQLDPATRSVAHGSQIFVIDPAGRIVQQAAFGVESADTDPFGHGLATLANDALPASERGTIAGADLVKAIPGGTEIGDTPTPLTGQSLIGSGTSSAASRGRFTVLDFWSSTCTACSVQLPDAQAEAASLGTAIAFLGVDVGDAPATGRASAAANHFTIPTVSDPQGTQAARFRVSELPYTVILSPTGSVLVRHPGLFTTEELDYTLHSLDPALPDAH
ncbi:redoxin domain-containing protein [uncultured Microbacterium sp.]|uniref:redoxin domain-containing protein n=1 Tax=uncultured Microbacterium sp. TaxID=191216 RepID=UPI0025CC0814|nr:redoxin domain-containing protein [uncultured Microbacterium sp.]